MLNTDALSQLKKLKNDIHAQRNLAKGVVKGSHSRFGFVTLTTGKDVFLSPEQMNRVLPGDEVEIEIFTDAKGQTYGEVTKLIKTHLSVFAAELRQKNRNQFAEPHLPNFSRWLFIPPNRTRQAKEGELIKCRLTQHPFQTGKPQVEVLERLGTHDQTGIERAYTKARFDIRDYWPKEVIGQVRAIEDKPVSVEGREDLRITPFVTIDAATTEDMDDALYAEKTDNGWKLTVAIADPTELIESDSPIEREAFRRSASVYLPGAPVTMLPTELTRSLASLVANEDRYALVCAMDVSEQGQVTGHRISLAVIRSAAKLSYEQVQAAIEKTGDTGLSDAVQDNLIRLAEVARRMKNWRTEHGNVREEQPDYRLILNDQQKIDHIVRIPPTIAHEIVEEAMIAANVCAADFLVENSKHGLFVTHRGIRPEKYDNVNKLIEEKINPAHGTSLRAEQTEDPAVFAELSSLAERTPDDNPLRTIIHRQLARTELSLSEGPHCGMGLPRYTNFTSPIRKFPDFYAHRLIKHVLKGTPVRKMTAKSLDMLQETLGRTRQAAQYMEGWLKAQYAEQLKGQILAGKIVRSISSGFFVRLEETGIEGFVSTKDMPEKYSFDQVYFSLTGKSRTFRLEQPVEVVVTEIDFSRNQVIFTLAEDIAPIQAQPTQPANTEQASEAGTPTDASRPSV